MLINHGVSKSWGLILQDIPIYDSTYIRLYVTRGEEYLLGSGKSWRSHFLFKKKCGFHEVATQLVIQNSAISTSGDLFSAVEQQ